MMIKASSFSFVLKENDAKLAAYMYMYFYICIIHKYSLAIPKIEMPCVGDPYEK